MEPGVVLLLAVIGALLLVVYWRLVILLVSVAFATLLILGVHSVWVLVST